MNFFIGVVSYLSIGKIESLFQYPIKGFGGEALPLVKLKPSATFPNDRQFALLKKNDVTTFDPENPVWLHKANFLCTFTNPELLSTYEISVFKGNERLDLDLFDRASGEQVLPTINMSTECGRQSFASFFSEKANTPLTCVTAKNHQFGNTSSSWKRKKDTRTVHIVNKATVEELSEAFGVRLYASRFRPNIVVDGPPAWSEWDWIDKEILLGSVKMKVISKTVRCDGISVDPLDHKNVLDIPNLLVKHFPQHGPYLGVYATVEEGGTIKLEDDLSIT
ncbi:unnamed protein product [Cylindrotheca closterium]|uniref:MOSC domain-containing protein n=1 Tax=Cylindrotheca closterium TaxID=2856 RepID=A0AAD2FIY4_9STRA|nr:unnamed protein product [Cylindrotheca closterium]